MTADEIREHARAAAANALAQALAYEPEPLAELHADTALTAEQEIRARALECASRLIPWVDHTDSLLRDVEQMAIGTAERFVGWIADGDDGPWSWAPKPPVNDPDDACRACPEGASLRKQLSLAEYEVGKARAERSAATRTALELREQVHTVRVERDNARDDLRRTDAAEIAALNAERDRLQRDFQRAVSERDEARRFFTAAQDEAEALKRQRDEVLKLMDEVPLITPIHRSVIDAIYNGTLTAPSATEDDEAGVAGVTGGAERQRGSEGAEVTNGD